MLHEGHFPIGALFLEIPAQDVDVNVHPAKTIVRIAQEERVNQELRRILKDILAEQALISHVNLDDARTDSIFGTPLGGVTSKSRAAQVSNIDSLQKEFEIGFQDDENIKTTMPTMRPLSLHYLRCRLNSRTMF